MNHINQYLEMLTGAINALPKDVLQEHIDILKLAHAEGRQVFLLGNGGSAMTAAHIACDFQKGIKEATGKRFKAISITDNVALMTAWANDTDYDNIFSEQLDSLLHKGDIVIAISGSGNSPNVLRAVERANELGAITLGWSGFDGGKLARLVHKPLIICSDNMQRIEDVHMIIGHTVFAVMMSDGTPDPL